MTRPDDLTRALLSGKVTIALVPLPHVWADAVVNDGHLTLRAADVDPAIVDWCRQRVLVDRARVSVGAPATDEMLTVAEAVEHLWPRPKLVLGVQELTFAPDLPSHQL